MPRAILDAAGALHADYERVDWAATPLGAMAGWSPALRNAADLALHTRFPLTLLWGPQFVLVYNEAYAQMIADKHPAALGRPAREVFPEAWHIIGPMMESVSAGEGATWVEDEPVPLLRDGVLREAYFTFSYSPVRGAGGDIEGVIDIAADTTEQVIDRRRLELLNRLGALLATHEDEAVLLRHGLELLREDTADFPAVDVRPYQTGDGVGVEQTAAGPVATVPLGRGPGGGPSLAVRLSPMLAPDAAYLGFLRLVGATLGQALDRAGLRAGERAAAELERVMSETLQRSLLTPPAQPDRTQVAVRYRPAAVQAQIGGDWYDAFAVPGGPFTVVVGDVAGHDQLSAAAMAQVRNLLRGIAFGAGGPPGDVLAGLDRAVVGLGTGVYATAVLVHVEPPAAGAPWTVRWSLAGHPPPVLVAADGRASMLEAPPDPLLGIGGVARHTHALELAPGSTLVLYTDGLVERRRVPIEQGFAWLCELLEGTQDLDAEAVCDRVLSALQGRVEDDVALLALRVH